VSARRSPIQIAADRQRIVDFVVANGGRYLGGIDRAGLDRIWVRKQDWMRPGDVAALVDKGLLERKVEREFDRQPHRDGWGASLFGGAGVCVRHRAYLARPR